MTSLPSTAKPIVSLKDLWAGQAAYVIGSGPSMDYYPDGFFNGKKTIGCNRVYLKYTTDYIVAKELLPDELMTIHQRGSKPVTSRHHYGNIKYAPHVYNLPGVDHYVFDHKTNQHTVIDWSILGTDQLIVSYSTITSAIHLAAYMGAQDIYLCGCDAGEMDGRLNYDGYPSVTSPEQSEWYKQFLRDMRRQTIDARDQIQRHYGCCICSISPFVNMAHEGHTYRF